MIDHFQYDDLVERGMDTGTEDLDDILPLLINELPFDKDGNGLTEEELDALIKYGELCFMAGRSFQTDLDPLSVEQGNVTFNIPAATAGRLLEALLGD